MVEQRAQGAICPFCEIAAGRAPAFVLTETDDALAILDIAPVRRGHALILPRRHVEDLTSTGAREAVAALAGPLTEVSALLVERLGASGLTCIQANGASAGQEIAHLHFHLVPRFTADERWTIWTRQPRDRCALEQVFRTLSGG
ncbi:HIT family protein [Promicromonospora sp. Marseille-Q5078]